MPALAITLPQFRSAPDATLEALEDGRRLGYAGGFVFDHLWPLGQPQRPALECWTLLAGLAGRLSAIEPGGAGAFRLGTLVTRAGLRPPALRRSWGSAWATPATAPRTRPSASATTAIRPSGPPSWCGPSTPFAGRWPASPPHRSGSAGPAAARTAWPVGPPTPGTPGAWTPTSWPPAWGRCAAPPRTPAVTPGPSTAPGAARSWSPTTRDRHGTCWSDGAPGGHPPRSPAPWRGTAPRSRAGSPNWAMPGRAGAYSHSWAVPLPGCERCSPRQVIFPFVRTAFDVTIGKVQCEIQRKWCSGSPIWRRWACCGGQGSGIVAIHDTEQPGSPRPGWIINRD